MLLHFSTKGLFNSFPPKDTSIHEREKDGHVYLKEGDLQSGLPKEATVLGTIQILCSLTIASLGGILVSASYSSHFGPETSAILMSGYPFVGALCFAIAGSLSIISGKISTKPFAVSSLASNMVSSVAAGAGLILLTYSLVTLGTASLRGHPEKKSLSSLPDSEYHNSLHESKDCLLADAGVTGCLVVILIFTVLELLLTVYASIFWWKLVYSDQPESQGVIQHVKKIASKSWI